jgi:hypothetical protein
MDFQHSLRKEGALINMAAGTRAWHTARAGEGRLPMRGRDAQPQPFAPACAQAHRHGKAEATLVRPAPGFCVYGSHSHTSQKQKAPFLHYRPLQEWPLRYATASLRDFSELTHA